MCLGSLNRNSLKVKAPNVQMLPDSSRLWHADRRIKIAGTSHKTVSLDQNRKRQVCLMCRAKDMVHVAFARWPYALCFKTWEKCQLSEWPQVASDRLLLQTQQNSIVRSEIENRCTPQAVLWCLWFDTRGALSSTVTQMRGGRAMVACQDGRRLEL